MPGLKYNKLTWMFMGAGLFAVVLVALAMSWLENEPKRKLESLGYQQVHVTGQVPGCKDGRGYLFNATGPTGGYRNGVLCIYSDHIAVTIVNKRTFN